MRVCRRCAAADDRLAKRRRHDRPTPLETRHRSRGVRLVSVTLGHRTGIGASLQGRDGSAGGDCRRAASRRKEGAARRACQRRSCGAARLPRSHTSGSRIARTAVPASDATMYRWASISKPLTAVVAMQLPREKTLDLDRDVRKYVPEFPEKPWPVTARTDLLCHQSGIVHYTNGHGRSRTVEVYAVEHPARSTSSSTSTRSRSRRSCSSRAPGTPTRRMATCCSAPSANARRGGAYADLVRDRIAAKAGMTTLQPDYQWIDDPPPRRRLPEEGRRGSRSSTDTDVSWKLPGGGFISSVGDLARFGAAMLGSDARRRRHRSRRCGRHRRPRRGDDDDLRPRFWRRESRMAAAASSHSGAQEKTVDLPAHAPR